MLGQGGMSAVYKATDPNLRRVVAVKMIHPHLSTDPEFVRRFEEEAAAVARLRHPNIVQVFDFNHDGNVYYMVLEFVPGETLQQRLRRFNESNRRLPFYDVVQIMSHICDAVAYAHQNELVHRDIKPANIMMNMANEPILMDFGIARILGGQTHTATGATVGTALYMSPEQAQGKRADGRSDIYSLGVTLFEMVSGRPPFEGDSAMSIMMRHITDPVPDLRELNPDTPPDLEAVIHKALEKDPARRFQSADEMAEALRAADLSAPPSAGSTVVERAAPGAETFVEAGAAAPISSREPTWQGKSAREVAFGEPPQDVAPAPPRGSGRPTGRSGMMMVAGIVGVVLLLACIGGAVLLGSRLLAGGDGSDNTGDNSGVADLPPKRRRPTCETPEATGVLLRRRLPRPAPLRRQRPDHRCHTYADQRRSRMC
jgi:serine/threonine protein kinase